MNYNDLHDRFVEDFGQTLSEWSRENITFGGTPIKELRLAPLEKTLMDQGE